MLVDSHGRHQGTDHKPDFSEWHLWARFFTQGFSLYERAAVLRAGGFRSAFAAASEYDLALRLARQLPRERIRHVAEALFQRGVSAEPLRPADEPQQVEHELAAVRQAMRVAGVAGTAAAHACGRGVHRLEFVPQATPRVVLVIPTRNQAGLLRRCVDAVRASTAYPNYQLVIVNNESREPELFDLFEENRGRPDFTWVDYAQPFNHSALHNEVLARVDAEFAVLLNNDVLRILRRVAGEPGRGGPVG